MISGPQKGQIRPSRKTLPNLGSVVKMLVALRQNPIPDNPTPPGHLGAHVGLGCRIMGFASAKPHLRQPDPAWACFFLGSLFCSFWGLRAPCGPRPGAQGQGLGTQVPGPGTRALDLHEPWGPAWASGPRPWTRAWPGLWESSSQQLHIIASVPPQT